MWGIVSPQLHPNKGAGEFTHTAFSPDSKKLAVSTTLGYIAIYNVTDPGKVKYCVLHESVIPYFVWSKNGKYLITCSHDKTCAVTNAKNRKKVASFELKFKGTFCGVNDWNSRIVCADSNGLLYLFIKGEEAPVFVTMTCPSVMTGLCYQGNGGLIVATFCDSTCKVFDETFTLISSYSVAPTDTYVDLPHFSACAISESGKTVFVRVANGRIISFDPKSGKPDDLVYTGFAEDQYPGNLFYFKAKRELVAQSEDGRIIGWDLVSHEIKWQYVIEDNRLFSMGMSHDGELVATINMEKGTLTVYQRL